MAIYILYYHPGRLHNKIPAISLLISRFAITGSNKKHKQILYPIDILAWQQKLLYSFLQIKLRNDGYYSISYHFH